MLCRSIVMWCCRDDERLYRRHHCLTLVCCADDQAVINILHGEDQVEDEDEAEDEDEEDDEHLDAAITKPLLLFIRQFRRTFFGGGSNQANNQAQGLSPDGGSHE